MREEVEISEAAEEMLARLWPDQEETPHGACGVAADEAAQRELLARELIASEDGSAVLTEAGRQAAANVIRRERLAERLLVDVLKVGEALAAETACKFEHLLRRGIDDEICTLLGHPRVCPHGRPIPPGPCCREGTAAAGKVVSALADLAPGEEGVVAYLHSQRRESMSRLLAMGVIPGARLTLQQKYPSIVFSLGSAQLAVDEETARDIYVRPMSKPRRRRRSSLGRLWRGRR